MTAMNTYEPTYSRGLGAPTATAIRGNGETVVCEACGCRLTTRDSADDAGFGGSRSWHHFRGSAGRDARGCAVPCADAAHALA